jgi:acyl carrier protein
MNKFDEVLAQVFDDEGEPLAEDTPFTDGPGWDSLKHVALIVAMQRQFDVDLSPEEIARMTSKRTARAVLAERGVVV